jgi:hypothetical protein
VRLLWLACSSDCNGRAGRLALVVDRRSAVSTPETATGGAKLIGSATTFEDDRRPTNGHSPRRERLALVETPPHNADAEHGLLAAEIYSPGRFAELGVVRSDFYTGTGREIFDVLDSMRQAGAPISFETLRYFLKTAPTVDSMSLWEMVGGEATVSALECCTSAATHARYYFEIVRRAATCRAVKERALALAGAAAGPDVDLGHLFERADFSDLQNGNAPSNRFKAITSAELANVSPEIEYLVDGVLVKGQPCILAGGKKTLKTNLLVDLSLTLSHGGLFLGAFKAQNAVRVGMLSGESGAATIAETARRIANAKRWGLEYFDGVLWGFTLPRLGEPGDMAALRSFIVANKLDVLIIDPTYLALPLGDSAANLFEVGAKLIVLTELGQELGCTIILAHHTRKNVVNAFEPPELEDIAWAGFPEWARQWILIGRRQKYDPEQGGHHRLWLNLGGSVGHSSLWALNVDEGTRQDPGGRKWVVDVVRASAARAEAAASDSERRTVELNQKQAADAERDRKAILTALAKFPEGDTAKVIREAARLSGTRFTPTVSDLVAEGAVERLKIQKGNGHGYDGYRLSTNRPGLTGTDRDNEPCPGGGVRSGTNPPKGGVPVPLHTHDQVHTQTTGTDCPDGWDDIDGEERHA